MDFKLHHVADFCLLVLTHHRETPPPCGESEEVQRSPDDDALNLLFYWQNKYTLTSSLDGCLILITGSFLEYL